MRAISNPHGFRGLSERRAGAGPAVVSALALHAACVGALVGLGYLRPTPPPQETVVELAMVPAPEPPALPEPPASSPPAAQPVSEPVAPPPEPVEAAAVPAETALPPPPEPDPKPVEAAAAPMVEPPPDAPPPAPPIAPEPAVVSAPPPIEAPPRPLPQSVHAPPRPPQHAATLPRATQPRQETLTTGAPANSAAATPTAQAAFGSSNQEATLEARIRDAVQAAVHYPASARMMGITGRVRLLLDYRSGNVAGPMLTQSSGTPTLDEAALAAARAARYPPAPPEIEGRLLRLLVWVEFRPG